jgi:Fe-S-cluster containining protein
MQSVTLNSFKRKLKVQRAAFRRFLNKSAKTPPKGIDNHSKKVEKGIWDEIDCLTCGNCCKKMTPTFTEKDLIRISAHFNQTPQEFKKQWLRKSGKDWVNVKQPCQFLNKTDNKCSIYEIRPVDCAGFPHLSRRKWEDFANMHKQNIDYCPATFKLVEHMVAKFEQA